jgi:hypothetical protein
MSENRSQEKDGGVYALSRYDSYHLLRWTLTARAFLLLSLNNLATLAHGIPQITRSKVVKQFVASSNALKFPLAAQF